MLQSGVFPTSSDWSRVLLPTTVNVPGTQAIQPTFSAAGLWFTQDVSIAFAGYSGSHDAIGIADPGNWSAPTVILQKDTSITSLQVTANDLGKIIAIGEPTVADVGGRTVLWFVYAWVRGIDPVTGYADLDFQAGFVERDSG